MLKEKGRRQESVEGYFTLVSEQGGAVGRGQPAPFQEGSATSLQRLKDLGRLPGQIAPTSWGQLHLVAGLCVLGMLSVIQTNFEGPPQHWSSQWSQLTSSLALQCGSTFPSTQSISFHPC